MSEARWRLRYAGSGRRELRRLDRPVQRRVIEALERLTVGEPTTRKLVKLRGRPGWRLRVGEWRVIVELDENTRTIWVKRVLPRGRAYDR